MDSGNKEKKKDIIEGWKGSLPSKPFPVNSDHELLEDNPNVEYHDHGPKDKCDSSCRFFKSADDKHHIVPKIQAKKGLT